jgi:5-oxoprolinase (ATP-hydrolysing)
MTRTFVDRGGTFTDVLTWLDDGQVHIRKVPSDRAVVGELAEGELIFGTTVATNALLERTGARTLLLVTRGFADLIHIGDGSRPALFRPEAEWPAPLCDRVCEVDGRLAADGTPLTPLAWPAELDFDDVDSVAIVLLHSGLNPTHELELATLIRARRPELFISLGHQVSPEVGYLARIETTLVDAAITPALQAAIRQDRIPAEALAMQSDGGLCPAQSLRAPDAVLSGPAGGVVAVAEVAKMAGFQSAVGLDMGGTSTDVCRVDAGDLPRREGEVRVAGIRLRRPMLEVNTIAAGGGSILWNDGLRLGVGPTSAGADPGPQCYGRGGPPTLTDAALAQGLIQASGFDPPLNPSVVQLPGEAEAFLAIARDQMAAAIRQLATARGVDLRDHALVAFGGAAGQHAADVAERLDIRTVLVHPCAGVLSAWGQAMSRQEATGVVPIWQPLATAWPRVEEAWAQVHKSLPQLQEVRRSVELRHAGTDHAIEVVARTPDAARSAFLAIHRRRYGFDRDGAIEVVNARVRVRGAEPPQPPQLPNPWPIQAAVLGPRTLHSKTTSVHIPRGWQATWSQGLLQLHRVQVEPTTPDTHRTPLGVALWGARFMSVAEQAGAVLQRLSRSVNIRERLDFSCAIFDGAGGLVANAPHIPVHLGAMGVTVRDLLATHANLVDGQSWLCNDPAAGGSHLPDLTVITPLRLGDHRFFVASRAHHVDVGGITPGSMPPHSTHLDEEGIRLRHLPLLKDGVLAPLDDALAGCRQLDTVRADLEAQLAANQEGCRLLAELGPPEVLAAWMAHLQDVADDAVGQVFDRLPIQAHAIEHLDGVHLSLALRQERGMLVVDLSGSGGPHPGNLNAPEAVVRAAVLYAIRVLVDAPIPLNEGALRRVHLVLPHPSIVSPPTGAAVAGGNVETSQRLVDLFLRAAGRMAASAGTMSNLTLGGPGWSLYETIAAGQGASELRHGAHCRQVHMTNTRATDPEVVEHRLPVRLCGFSRRRHTGGQGRTSGGDGTLRTYELTAPGQAALLATRRDAGAPGEAGGSAAAPGADRIRINGRWRPWDGRPVSLQTGDRVEVGTPGGGGWGPPNEGASDPS